MKLTIGQRRFNLLLIGYLMGLTAYEYLNAWSIHVLLSICTMPRVSVCPTGPENTIGFWYSTVLVAALTGAMAAAAALFLWLVATERQSGAIQRSTGVCVIGLTTLALFMLAQVVAPYILGRGGVNPVAVAELRTSQSELAKRVVMLSICSLFGSLIGGNIAQTLGKAFKRGSTGPEVPAPVSDAGEKAG